MDKQESVERLLLAQRETTWDALKQWNEDLNKLIYWLALVNVATTATLSQEMPLALAILVAALPAWLYMYLRGSYWYGVNMTVLAHIESRLNSRVADQHVPGSAPPPVLVQAKAGCDGSMSPRAPWPALVGATITFLYILFAGLHIPAPKWQGYQVYFYVFWGLLFIAMVFGFYLFCRHKHAQLRRLPDELTHGFKAFGAEGAHNTAAQADNYVAA